MAFTQNEMDTARQAHKSRLGLTKYMGTVRGLHTVYMLMGLDPNTVSDRQALACHTIREQLVYACENATSLAIPQQMCEMTEIHAPHYPGTRIDPGDMTVPFGWAHFAKPITDPVRADAYPLRGVMWWTHRLKEVTGNEDETEYAITMIGLADTRNFPGADERTLSHLPRALPVTSLVWRLGTEDGGLDATVWEAHESRAYLQTLCTLWALIRQRMVQTEVVHKVMPREYAEYQRKRNRKVNNELRVLRMGPSVRHVYDYFGPNRMDEATAWWVRAHWRNHWFPKLETHKPKLILPYPKGDPDAPVLHEDRMLLPPLPLADDR